MPRDLESLREGWYIDDQDLMNDLDQLIGSLNTTSMLNQLRYIVNEAIDRAYGRGCPFRSEKGPVPRESVIIDIDNSDPNAPQIIINVREKKSEIITQEQFHHTVGRAAINDDLERCNCDKAGETGHISCGWCQDHNRPRFVCGCIINKRVA
jgi:hypothetical protein